MDDRAAEKRQTAAAAGVSDRKYGKGRNDDVPRGIICMVVATILFAAASAASKWLVGLYPVGEVLCLRSFASLAAGAAMILPVSGLSAFVTIVRATTWRAAFRNRSRSFACSWRSV